jgi:hypothetical protein
VALECQQHLRHLVGQLEADQTAADADGGEVRLVGDALGQLDAAAQQALETGVYDRPLLTESGSLARSGGSPPMIRVAPDQCRAP